MKLPTAFLDRPIAHRCLHDVTDGRPENSYEALDRAINLGYPVEIDLQCSKDGVAMVFHDDRLDRLTTHQGALRDFQASELSGIRLSGGVRTIPRFDEFCAHLAGRVPILIELKDQSGQLTGSDSRFITSIAKTLATYQGEVALMSFNPDLIADCKTAIPDRPRGLVTDPFVPMIWPNVPRARLDALREIGDFDPIGASFISHNHADLTSDIVQNIAKRAPVLCWTIKSQAAADQALEIAQNITFEAYLPDGTL